MSKESTNDSNSFVSNDVSLNLSTQRQPITVALGTWISTRYLTIIALLILIAALYIVVFTLPSNVQPAPQINSADFVKEALNKPIDVSPWQEAQLAKNRQYAQTILSKVMKKQKLLEQKKVKTWAKTDFLQAIKLAESGDVHYRLQEFEQALHNYQQTLAQLQAIEDRIDNTFNDYYQLGKMALTASNQQLAIEKLTIALHIKPDDELALIAIERSKVLHEVITLIDEGTVLIAEQNLNAAKAKFLAAQVIDSRSEIVVEQLNVVNNAIVEQNYSKAMSQGYKYLNQQSYPQALLAFNVAKKVRPQLIDPQKAITETKNKQTQAIITEKSRQATNDEALEQWSKAIALYQEILSLDNTLMSARIGLIRSQSRHKLDSELNTVINKPARLTNNSVYREAIETLNDAKKLKQAGAKLNQQIVTISSLLQKLTVAVPLFITSDNQTQITLYRVGELGNFINKELQLRPGEYTFVGSREGYRDVRHQVTIMPDSDQHTLEISCIEKVSNG